MNIQQHKLTITLASIILATFTLVASGAYAYSRLDNINFNSSQVEVESSFSLTPSTPGYNTVTTEYFAFELPEHYIVREEECEKCLVSLELIADDSEFARPAYVSLYENAEDLVISGSTMGMQFNTDKNEFEYIASSGDSMVASRADYSLGLTDAQHLSIATGGVGGSHGGSKNYIVSQYHSNRYIVVFSFPSARRVRCEFYDGADKQQECNEWLDKAGRYGALDDGSWLAESYFAKTFGDQETIVKSLRMTIPEGEYPSSNDYYNRDLYAGENGAYFTQLLEQNCLKEDVDCVRKIIEPSDFDYFTFDYQGAPVYVYEKEKINVSMAEVLKMGGHITKTVDLYSSITGETNENMHVYIGSNLRWGVGAYGRTIDEIPLDLLVVREIQVSEDETIVISQWLPLTSAGDARIISTIQPFAIMGTEENFKTFTSFPETFDNYDAAVANARAAYVGKWVLYYEQDTEAQTALAVAIRDNPNFLSASEKTIVRDTTRHIAELELE